MWLPKLSVIVLMRMPPFTSKVAVGVVVLIPTWADKVPLKKNK